MASANVVGYTTIDIQSKYQIVGVNFQSVDGTSLKLNDLIPYQEGMTKGNTADTADQIQVGDETGGWTIYYMSNGKNGKGNTVDGLEGKWAEGGKYTPANVELTPGSAFWYVRHTEDSNSFKINVAGSVTTLPTANFEFAAKYRIFANPYTVDLPLNGGSFAYNAETMTAGNNADAADQIQIGDNVGGWTIYYLSNGKNGKGNAVEGLEGKWAEGGKYTVSDACIPVGKAAWYVRKDETKPALSVTLAKPYDL